MRPLILCLATLALVDVAHAEEPLAFAVYLVAEKEGTPLPAAEGEPVNVEQPPILTAADITAVEVAPDGVRITLTPEGGARFAKATGEHVGRTMAIATAGTVQVAPKVMEAITGGVIMLTLPDPEAAKATAEKLAPPPPPPPPCLTVQVSHRLGAVRLGMTQEQVKKIAPPVEDATGWLKVGDYRVRMGMDGVSMVELPLTAAPCFAVNGRDLPSATAPQALAAALAGCGPTRTNEGGNEIRCPVGATVLWAGDGGKGPTVLRVEREGHPLSTCDAYLVPGAFAATRHEIYPATKEAPAALPIGGAAAVCVAGRRVTDATSVSEVNRPGCQLVKEEAGAMVTCEGVRYLFGGERTVLARVEAVIP